MSMAKYRKLIEKIVQPELQTIGFVPDTGELATKMEKWGRYYFIRNSSAECITIERKSIAFLKGIEVDFSSEKRKKTKDTTSLRALVPEYFGVFNLLEYSNNEEMEKQMMFAVELVKTVGEEWFMNKRDPVPYIYDPSLLEKPEYQQTKEKLMSQFEKTIKSTINKYDKEGGEF